MYDYVCRNHNYLNAIVRHLEPVSNEEARNTVEYKDKPPEVMLEERHHHREH